MKKIIAALLFISLFLASQTAFAGGVGRITYVEGRVDLSRPGSDMALPLRQGEEISAGDAVRTKANSRAEVRFNDGSILRLAQNSKVDIKDYQLDKENRRTAAAVMLERGRARVIIAKMPRRAGFDILTPNAQGRVKGSDIFAFYQAGSSGMLVAEGNLSLNSLAKPESAVTVPAGNSATVSIENVVSGPRPYIDLEKKLYEQDTHIPPAVPRRGEKLATRGVIAAMSGAVKITAKGAAAPHDAAYNEVLGEGDLVETGENGAIEIKFDNGCGLSLKPNTIVRITKLIIDPETGIYQNLFESSKGKIKARIENLKKGSSFEIKTPTAVCGARGTFMYIAITPEMTKAFFEGGNGYMKNLLSGTETQIGVGYNSASDNQGNTSEPAPTSGEERDNWTEGWAGADDSAGYSPGDSGANDNLGGAGDNTLGSNNVNNDTGRNDDGDDANFYIPPEPSSSSTALLPSVSLTGAFSRMGRDDEGDGAFGYYDTYFNQMSFDSYSSISASLYGEGDLWGGSSVPIAILGSYSNSSSLKLWEVDNLSGEISDGAQYRGLMAGAVNETDNSIKGILYAFYVRPTADGNRIGYLKSTGMAGGTSSEDGIFTLTGYMTSHIDIPTTLLPSELSSAISEDAFSGQVGGDNGLSGTLNGKSLQVHGIIGDIFRMELGGSSGPQGDDWNAVMGGEGTDENVASYWIMHITGDEWSQDGLHGAITGRDIGYSNTPEGRYDFSWLGAPCEGEFLGDQNEYTWEGVALGYIGAEPLLFGGTVDGSFGYFEIDYEDPRMSLLYLDQGSISSVFGGTKSPWTGEPEITMIGKFQDADTYQLWGSDFFAGDTKDGGAILGFVGGTKANNALKGLLYAIYVKPDANGGYEAGYLKSTDLSGDFYETIGMFEATGTLLAGSGISTTMLPSQLFDGSEYVGKGSDHDLINAGQVSNSDFSGALSVESFDIDVDGGKLGVWRVGGGGDYETEAEAPWKADFGGWSDDNVTYEKSYWKGTISGAKGWGADGTFSGEMNGTILDRAHIQEISGKFVGYYEDGMWGMYAVGSNNIVTDLTSSGRFGAQGWNAPEGFDFYGAIGLSGHIWSEGAAPKFISIGEFNSGGASQFAWNSVKDGERESLFYSMYSSDTSPVTYTYTTYDDESGIGGGKGAIVGLGAGVGAGSGGKGILKGLIYALYIDPSENAGVIHGSVSGDYSDGANTYRIDGTLTKDAPRSTAIGILPQDLYANIKWSVISGDQEGGGFHDGGEIIAESMSGTALKIAGQNWGVWDLAINGSYSGPVSETWQLYDMTGLTSPADDTEAGGAWLGGITGTKWSSADHELGGTMDGIWIKVHSDGTLSGGIIEGETVGNYVDVEEGATWHAASAGEWVEERQLLDLADTSANGSGVMALANLANMPLTEAHPEIMNQIVSGTTGIISAAVDMRLYSMEAGADGIWAAIISGQYSTPPTAGDWNVTVTNGADYTALSGPAWAVNPSTGIGEWTADVTGTVAGSDINGKAAGTYSDGTFNGAGTGTTAQSQLE